MGVRDTDPIALGSVQGFGPRAAGEYYGAPIICSAQRARSIPEPEKASRAQDSQYPKVTIINDGCLRPNVQCNYPTPESSVTEERTVES